ncbi:putative U3 small nucleolar RNA-associated protein 7, partial [Kickxella alabastrina]
MFSAEKAASQKAKELGTQNIPRKSAMADNDNDNESDNERAPRTLREATAKADTKKGNNKDSKKDNNKRAKPVETAEPDAIEKRVLEQAKKYQRGGSSIKSNSTEKTPQQVKSKKAASKIQHEQRRREEAALAAARSEMLLTEDAGFLEAEGMERTYKITQNQLAPNLDLSSAAKIFDLKLPDFGPYSMQYSANGRNLLLGGRKGHLATMDWRNGRLGCELHVRETVRDVCWLHNESLFAVAQKKHVYIYDHSGAEVHCLRKHVEPTALGFLPFHFLLASTGMTGQVVFQDITEGGVVGEHRPGYGPNHVLRVNPHNAVVHVGHGNGTVTLWAPQQQKPLAKLLCHRGPLQAMAIDRSGTYMATSGLDGRVKVWDVRTFRQLHDYQTMRPAQSLDISQRGLLAAAWGPHVSIWKDALATRVDKPYMTQLVPGATLSSVRFVPYDDVLGYGHSGGVSSMVVPGAGEPNFDAYVANPYQTTKQRQETEVKQLLDKLAPETIQLDPTFIGRLDPRSKAQMDHTQLEEQRSKYAADKAAGRYLDNEVKNKMKGRNSTAKRFARKRQSNITDLKKLQDMERMDRELREAAERARPVPEAEKGALG